MLPPKSLELEWIYDDSSNIMQCSLCMYVGPRREFNVLEDIYICAYCWVNPIENELLHNSYNEGSGV